MPHPQSHIITIILAGGGGERLGGVVKANLTVGGTRLIERAASAIGDLPFVVGHGPVAPERFGLTESVTFAPDLPLDYAGPLAGLAGAVAALADNPPGFLLTMAVDTPFLPRDFAERLLAALRHDAGAVVARYCGQDYPTNALWCWDAVKDLPQRMAAGTAPRSLRRLAEALDAVYLDWPAQAGGDPFANLNTIGDLIALNRRAMLEKA